MLQHLIQGARWVRFAKKWGYRVRDTVESDRYCTMYMSVQCIAVVKRWALVPFSRYLVIWVKKRLILSRQ